MSDRISLEDTKTEALVMWKSGESLGAICSRLGKAKSTVWGWVGDVPRELVPDRHASLSKAWEGRRQRLTDNSSREKSSSAIVPPVFMAGSSKQKGDASQLMVAARCAGQGWGILDPYGDNSRYDFLIENDEGDLCRVQCKTGQLDKGAIKFPACSSYAHRGRPNEGYHGQADVFGVYCPQTDGVYLVPVTGNPTTDISLRMAPPGNGAKATRWAEDYLLTSKQFQFPRTAKDA